MTDVRQERETSSSGPHRELLQSLQNTSSSITRLSEGFSDAELRWKESELEFSILENICHLRDLELQAYTPRINRILDEINPELPDFDGARVAAESNYHSEEPGQALLAFENARQANAQRLSGVNPEQWQREGQLAGVGKLTLARLMELMREHDEGHLEDMRVMRQRLRRSRETAQEGAA